MKKKSFYSTVLGTGVAALFIPFMAFSSSATAQTEIKPNQITLESGGTGVPMNQSPFNTAAYHEPTDGIITGAEGCQPDVHEFNKSNIGMGPNGPEHEHIVFTADIKEITTSDNAKAFDANGSKIYVEIRSNGQKVLEQEFYQHPWADPNTGKPFWVSAIYLKGDVPGGSSPARTAIDLPTGEYNYQFKAKDKDGHVLAVWVPENHKFTITDSNN